MKYLVKYSPEMTIKSRPVRTRFAKQLKRNLQVLLHRFSDRIIVAGSWDFVTVEVPEDLDSLGSSIEHVLASTQGICFFERVRHHTFTTLDEILAHTLDVFRDRLDGKTFCVRCKRIGRHNFNSMDVEKLVGGGLNRNTGSADDFKPFQGCASDEHRHASEKRPLLLIKHFETPIEHAA